MDILIVLTHVLRIMYNYQPGRCMKLRLALIIIISCGNIGQYKCRRMTYMDQARGNDILFRDSV